MKFIFQKNVELVEGLYSNGFIEKMGDKNRCKNIIDTVMVDPDKLDTELYMAVTDYYGKDKYKLGKQNGDLVAIDESGLVFACDCICGWKQLYDYYEGKDEWIFDYKKIRSCVATHFLFPKHANSINQRRYGSYLKDRFDFALYDIKNFYELYEDKGGNEEKIKTEIHKSITNKAKRYLLGYAYLQDKTYKWLAGFGSFEAFIDRMRLGFFVIGTEDDCNLEYQVRNLSFAYSENRIIEEYPDTLSFTKEYLENILKFVDESESLFEKEKKRIGIRNNEVFSFDRGSFFGGALNYVIFEEEDSLLFEGRALNSFHNMQDCQFRMPKDAISKLVDATMNAADWDEEDIDDSILDGYGWSIRLRFQGLSINKRGYCRYPTNYHKVVSKIQEEIEALCRAFADDYSDDGVEDRIKL